MKANELMIGDWVRTTETNKPHNVQILGIEVVDYNEMKYLINVDNGRYDWHCELHEIEPIPLTPEILEKNGFVSQSNIGYIIDDYDGEQIIYDSWNHRLRIIKDYKVCLDIELFDDLATHELQHALTICGIEKEIEI